MKRMATFVFIALIMTFSCSRKQEIPPNIFPVQKMKLIVWDLEIAEQTASEKFVLQKDSLRMEATSLYQQVFAKYKTNKATFYKSMSYYETHPDVLTILLDSVNTYGSRQRTEAYKKAY